jgi:hypothetical protein
MVRRARNNEVVELTLQLHHETDKAYLVSDSGDRDEAVWLPKSMSLQGDQKGPGIYLFEMPEWLAVEKKLM